MTTVSDWLTEARPALRESVHVGPGLLKGTSVVHIVGDRETHAFLRVGPREAFLMAQLDGTRTLADIGVAYAEQFGKRLGEAHWTQLLGLLHSHALIEPAAPEQLEAVREKTELARRAAGRSPLLWRRPVPGAADLVVPLARRIGWLLHPLAAVPLALAGTAVAVFVLLRWSMLWTAVSESPSRSTAAVVGLLVGWVVIAGHEFFHGIACVRYGGRPTEIGVMWRFPMIAPYCKVDDVVTFPRPGQRVVTSFAGVYVNLVALIPFAALWWWGPQSGWWHGLAAALLLFGVVAALANLIPVLKLDGYHMLEHATSTSNLQGESFRFAGAFLRHGPSGIAAYSRRARRIYAGYALLATAILGPALVLLIRSWYLTLADLWSPLTAIAVLVGEAVVVGGLLRWAVVWRRRATEEA
ncbi:M50 family metallopeptidase [Kribbella sp. VKM Ac-2568]|uniref:M50 family metallopeptidase n=1 Tax=Kribbella sp. VKM Ac-2568 TaxID=2512219 RepID=UPI00104FF5B0|nr:M50 family metallopeptidase [Kribbella sp. VKM Ac-2568]TCM51237.1 putative peptide zinc metalloprotease protein [Kribbella sp. VKM Ac-2568]